MNKEQRVLVSEKLFDAANIAAGAMLFGQSIGGQVFSLPVAFLGIGVWLGLAVWALRLQRS